MGRRKSKKSRRRPLRGSLGYNKNISSLTCNRRRNSSTYHSSNCDLNVPLPSITNKNKVINMMKELIDRLTLSGYSTAAFSHTIYGQPDLKKDKVDNCLDNMIQNFTTTNVDNPKMKNKEEEKKQPESSSHSIKLLKRLNVIIEELSDVALYSGEEQEEQNNPNKKPEPEMNMNTFLNSYDIIAISPRNDAVFGAVCSNAHACNVIILDYTTGGRLPFKLRPFDIAAATKRGAVFEICYASAIINPDKRKYFIQTGREFFLSSTLQNIKASLIVSSGKRIDSDGVDIGPLALRSPQDISNVIEVLFGLDTSNKRQIRSCLSSNPSNLIQQIINKKSGKSFNTNIRKPHSAQTLFLNSYRSSSSSNSNILSIKNNDILTNTTIQNLSSAPIIGQKFNIMDKISSSSLFVNNNTKEGGTSADKEEEVAIVEEKNNAVDNESDQIMYDDGFIAL